MKLRVEHIKLKNLITEATFQDAFSLAKQGDILIVKTGEKIYKSKIISKFSTQMTFEWDGQYYIVTDNSFDGKSLSTNRIVLDDNGKKKDSVKGPTIGGVYSIVIKRGNQIISGVTPSSGRPEKQEKVQDKAQEVLEYRHEEIFSVFKKLNKGDMVEITTGKLITKGRDKGSLGKNSTTSIKLKFEDMTGKWYKFSPVDFTGLDASEYKKYSNTYFFFDTSSIETTKEGIILSPKTKDLNTGDVGKLQIKGVFGVENIGAHEEEVKFTVDDIMKSPAMRNMMMKNPSLLDKILGRKATGIVPLQKQLNKLGLSTRTSNGKKVKFQYNGVDIRPDYRFNFKDDKIYVGKFTKNDVIKRTADNRRESMYITLGKQNDDKTYDVTIDFVKLVNNEPQREEVGTGKIKIIELTN